MTTPAPPPLISIIIPTYNSKKTIRTCLDSITKQSQKNFEVIIIDNLSTDQTIDIVKEYALIDEYIRYISEADTGIYNAMNKGIHHSKGDWLYFLGSDDLLYQNNTIETITPFLAKNTDIFLGNIFHALQAKTITQSLDKTKIYIQNTCHQAIFYSRRMISTIGEYDEKYKICADWKYNMLCIGHTDKIKHANITIAIYSGTGLSANVTDELFYRDRLETYLKAMRVNLFNTLLTPLRYELHKQSIRSMKSKNTIESVFYYLLYLFHGMRSKIS